MGSVTDDEDEKPVTEEGAMGDEDGEVQISGRFKSRSPLSGRNRRSWK